MNVVIRVTTDERSFILKQSRPFVQKYQQIEAPLDRINVEFQFYKAIKSKELEPHIPDIVAYDKEEHLIMMEDLGQCEDMISVYQNKDVEDADVDLLIQILNKIHYNKIVTNYPQNLALRQLNHQHIFVLPFMENNGFDLNEIQQGLQELSLYYKSNEDLKTVVHSIGEKYLSSGNVLLHGDFYPGSWMKNENRLYVIDPEFSFVGFAEFDLGVMAAHLIMATLDQDYVATICHKYIGSAEMNLVTKVAGIEIMRRLIGLAQLPLEYSIEEKDYLLKMAHRMILV